MNLRRQQEKQLENLKKQAVEASKYSINFRRNKKNLKLDFIT